MPIYDLDDYTCGTGDIVANAWSRGGCPGYVGTGVATGPIPDANGLIDTGGACLEELYVYKKEVNVGSSCEECIDLEIDFIDTPAVIPLREFFICRIGDDPADWNIDDNTITLDPITGDISYNPWALGWITRACDGEVWSFGDHGELQWKSSTSMWGPVPTGIGFTQTIAKPPHTLCSEIIVSDSFFVRNETPSSECGIPGECEASDSNIIWAHYSEMLNIGTCPSTKPGICYGSTVDFTSAAFYTPASNCDSILRDSNTLQYTLDIEVLTGAHIGETLQIQANGTFSMEAVSLDTYIGPGDTCVDIQYTWSVSDTAVGYVDCDLVGPDCVLEICRDPNAGDNFNFETCT